MNSNASNHINHTNSAQMIPSCTPHNILLGSNTNLGKRPSKSPQTAKSNTYSSQQIITVNSLQVTGILNQQLFATIELFIIINFINAIWNVKHVSIFNPTPQYDVSVFSEFQNADTIIITLSQHYNYCCSNNYRKPVILQWIEAILTAS